MAKYLEQKGYKVFPGTTFLDLDEDKRREIDIVATKSINGINIFLIIECKSSFEDDWVFILSDKSGQRMLNYVKYVPEIEDEENDVFNQLHVVNDSIPLANNYLVFNKKKGKNGDTNLIEKVIYELPKALLWAASFLRNKKSCFLYFPIGLFSKQIFSVKYKNGLRVRTEKIVQYQTLLESERYLKELRKIKDTNSGLDQGVLGYKRNFFENDRYHNDPQKSREIERVLDVKKLFGDYYQMILLVRLV